MEQDESISSIPIVASLSTSLFISLTILKSIGMIHCSWWWVTAPIWISFGAYLLGNIVFVVAILWLQYTFKFDEDDNYIEDCDKGIDKQPANMI